MANPLVSFWSKNDYNLEKCIPDYSVHDAYFLFPRRILKKYNFAEITPTIKV